MMVEIINCTASHVVAVTMLTIANLFAVVNRIYARLIMYSVYYKNPQPKSNKDCRWHKKK